MTVPPRRGPGGMTIYGNTSGEFLRLGEHLFVALDAGAGFGLAGLWRGGDPLLLLGQGALAGTFLFLLLG